MADRIEKVTLTAQVSGYLAGMEKASRATRETATEAENLAKKSQAMDQVGSAALAMGAVATVGLGLVAKAAIDWESAWTGVLKTVDGTPEQLAQIEDGLRSMAAELPASHAEIAAVAEAAGQLGVSADSVVQFTRTMVDLGETTNLTADEAATSIAQLMNIMQTAPDDVDRLGASLVALGNDGASTERDIVLMAQRIAGAGQIIGLSEGEVLAFANALASVGIEVEAGGSAISRIMTDIAKSVSAGGDDLEKFASVAGMSSAEFSTAFKDAPAEAIATFIEGLGGINAAGGDVFTTLSDLGQTDIRTSRALLGMANSGDLLRKSLELGNASWEDNTALMTEAEKRYATVEAQLGATSGAVNDAAISLGSVLMPVIADVAEGVAEFAGFMADMPDPLKEVAVGAVALAGGVALVGGAALTAVPRLVAFHASVAILAASSPNLVAALRRTAAFLTGPWGLAIAAATLGATAFMKYIDSLKASTEDMEAAFQGATKAADVFMVAGEGRTEWFQTFASAKTEISDLDGVLDTAAEQSRNFWSRIGDSSIGPALQQLKAMGSTLADMSKSDLPEAQRGFRLLADETDGTEQSLWRLLSEMPAYRDALETQALALGLVSAETTEAERKTALLELAQGKGEDASKDAAIAAEEQERALDALEGKSESTGAEIENLAETIRGFGSATLDVREANRSLEEAFDSLTDSVATNGTTLDIAEKAGRANQSALDDIAKSALEAAASTYEQTNSQEAANGVLAAGRTRLIEMLAQFGITGAAADAYVDELGLIPGNINTAVNVETDAAMRKLAAIREAMKMPAIVVTAEMRERGGYYANRADGGAIYGPGGPREDKAGLFALSNGEHVLTAEDVNRLGGQRGVYELRESLYKPRGYADGGAVQYAPQTQYITAPQAIVPERGGPQRIEGTLDLGNGIVGLVKGIVRDSQDALYLDATGGSNR